MPRLNLRAPSLEGDPGLDALASMYRTYTESTRLKETSEFNRAKSTVASLINSYNTANSQSLQEDIIESMKRYQSSLPADLKEAVQPYIAHGPTSPTAEKRRQFMQQFKPPKAPTYNEVKSEAVDLENKSKFINYQFQLHDYERALKIFMVGKEAAGDKLSFLPLADGSAAIRTKEGMIVQLSQADLKLKELGEKYKIEPKDILLNNGIIPTGKMGFTHVNGRKITTEEVYKPFAPQGEQYGYRITGVTEMPKSRWDVQHPANLTKLLLDWKSPDPDDKYVKDLKKRALKDPKGIGDELSQIFPQYTFRIIDISKKESWLKRVLNILPFVSADPRTAIIPIRGIPFGIQDKSGKVYKYYYDQTNDLVSNNLGEPLGTLADVQAELNSREIQTVK